MTVKYNYVGIRVESELSDEIDKAVEIDERYNNRTSFLRDAIEAKLNTIKKGSSLDKIADDINDIKSIISKSNNQLNEKFNAMKREKEEFEDTINKKLDELKIELAFDKKVSIYGYLLARHLVNQTYGIEIEDYKMMMQSIFNDYMDITKTGKV